MDLKMDLTSETFKCFPNLIQPGNMLNVYGWNDKINILVPLVLHSNNLSYFNGQITLLLQELITNLVVLANWSVFEEGIFKITVSPPKSNEISSILNMCLSEFWDSANSPTLKKKNCYRKAGSKKCCFIVRIANM